MGCGASKNPAAQAVDLKKVASVVLLLKSECKVMYGSESVFADIDDNEFPQAEEERLKAEEVEIAKKEAAEAELRAMEKQKEKERQEQERLQREAEEAERRRIEEERLEAEAAQREKEELEVPVSILKQLISGLTV